MMKILTISVAAYNVEQYLRRGLDSITDSRIIDDLEVFVIDDGSTDRTLEIAQEYAKRYPDSIFPVHQENGGYGTTINYGIAHAAGKYFKVLDGDDWFDTEGLVALVEELRKSCADVVLTPYFRCSADGVIQLDKDSERALRCLEKDFYVISEFAPKVVFGHWLLTYRTKMLQSIDMHCPAHMLYTDTIYVTVPFAYLETVQILEHGVYCYQLGRNGQSVSLDSVRKHGDEMLAICASLVRFYAAFRKECSATAYLQKRVAYDHLVALRSILQLPVNLRSYRKLKQYDQDARFIAPDIYAGVEQFGKQGKMVRLFRKTGYAAYWLLKLIPGGFVSLRASVRRLTDCWGGYSLNKLYRIAVGIAVYSCRLGKMEAAG